MADCLDNLEILVNYIGLPQSPSRVRFVHVSRSLCAHFCDLSLHPPPSLSSGLLSSDAGTSSAFTGHMWALGQRPADWSIWCWIISGSARVDVTNGGRLPAWSDIRKGEEGKRDWHREATYRCPYELCRLIIHPWRRSWWKSSSSTP